MSLYERRRWGNACRSDLEVAAAEVTPRQREGALGAWWVSEPWTRRDTEPTNSCHRYEAESEIKPTAQGAYASQRLSFGAIGKGLRGTVAKVANRTREIRPSGMKTGASGNVTMGAGLRPAAKAAEMPPAPYRARAGDLSKRSSRQG
jgi:hypothetical protein